MRSPRFVDRIAHSFSKSIADRLRRSLIFPAVMGIAGLFTIAWASFAIWSTLRMRTDWSSSSISLGIAMIFVVLGAIAFLAHRKKPNPVLVKPQEKNMQLSNETQSLKQTLETKAEETSELVKKGADEVVTWVRENPFSAVLVGAASGLLIGMVARRAFEGKSA